ncbi:MAG: chemotaxis protein CheR [Anaerolineae bacterium]|jgi:two-component system CheB/CheR fusion protein|nr:MAG: chemotaxis protein CheR [Anaerolineae bacterium]
MIEPNGENAREAESPLFYVGIGASAGGLEALEAFFSHMPADSGLAFVVIQHLSPDYKSMMVELLSKHTAMPVHRAEEGMQVKANNIYLIPPKKNLTIFHGKLLLSEQDFSKGLNLPIDVFFRSLADDQGEKAIGIILSGTGSDGVRGLRAIKETGGISLVQSIESARFDGMPRAAISSGLADFILPPDEMPSKLLAISKRPLLLSSPIATPSSTEEGGLERIFALIREATKVDFTYYKPSTVLRRIERRMTFNQIDDLPSYVRYLETHAAEVLALYRELLIGVTSFFRDREVFDELENNLLPALFQDSEKAELRIWVAGCSTGEEAYSLAILCREAMERNGVRRAVKIFATDIDRDALYQAGSGVYGEGIAADVPPRLLGKYFHHHDDRYQIDRSLREMVVFAQHNLIKDPPFTNIDLISCRNLLIYLQPVLQRKAIELFSFSLTPGGLLVLGTSETTGDQGDLFELLHPRYRIYRSKSRRRPGGDFHEFVASVPPLYGANRLYAMGALPAGQRAHEEERLFERFLQAIGGEFIPLAVIVNDRLEVLHIIGDPSDYFRLPSGKLVNDISRMAIKELSIPIATGLQKAFKTQKEIRYSNIRIPKGTETQSVDILIKPLPTKKNQEPLAAVFIQESSFLSRERRTNDVQVYDLNAEAEQRIRDLEQELQFTRENLQATIEELETSNEELQATNEELLASNQELQSANEELQSVNEELHTVNAEYQSKIIELTELTNDLDNLIASTRTATVFLDENLEIRRFTPEARQIFKILDTDIGRPLSLILHTLQGVDLLDLVKQVQEQGADLEQEVQTQSGEWYLLRIFPYCVGKNQFAGLVLSFTDISRLKATQNALSESEVRLASLYRAAPIGIAHWLDDRLQEVGGKLAEMLGYSEQELNGLPAEQLFEHRAAYQDFLAQLRAGIAQHSVIALEVSLRRKDGSLLPALVSAARYDEQDTAQGYTLTVTDLTLRHQAQREAQESRRLYELLFNTMMEGVVFQNADGEIIAANPTAERILGLSFDQMRGRTSFDPRWRAVDEDGTPLSGDQHPSMVALHSGKPVYGKMMGVFNPQVEQMRWIRVNAVPIYEGQAIKEVYTTFLDVTDERSRSAS